MDAFGPNFREEVVTKQQVLDAIRLLTITGVMRVVENEFHISKLAEECAKTPSFMVLDAKRKSLFEIVDSFTHKQDAFHMDYFSGGKRYRCGLGITDLIKVPYLQEKFHVAVAINELPVSKQD